MNRNLIGLLIRVAALSALVSAFMSLFLHMNIPGLTQIALGFMFLGYAMDHICQYKYSKDKIKLAGIILFLIAFVGLMIDGALGIIHAL